MPQGWLDVVRQVSLFLSFYFAYRLVRGMVEGRATAAFQHAREVISIERTLHLFVEPSVQAWASGSNLVMESASWLSAGSHPLTKTMTRPWPMSRSSSAGSPLSNLAIALVFPAPMSSKVRCFQKWILVKSL